ncbi:hypothetical protein BDN72DRAFT_866326 [Pluteus cervinus]|uniref:Uncharacterized protein n=1 Tax=Pluteus cervinus TaxID=181527 RepID=A0ACD2ZXA0_9AGAR|nr:hypothetical protein BDN72DRAFT_866326 [Pluteus cervinus]
MSDAFIGKDCDSLKVDVVVVDEEERLQSEDGGRRGTFVASCLVVVGEEEPEEEGTKEAWKKRGCSVRTVFNRRGTFVANCLVVVGEEEPEVCVDGGGRGRRDQGGDVCRQESEAVVEARGEVLYQLLTIPIEIINRYHHIGPFSRQVLGGLDHFDPGNSGHLIAAASAGGLDHEQFPDFSAGTKDRLALEQKILIQLGETPKGLGFISTASGARY